MGRLNSYLATAAYILQHYKPGIPFSIFIAGYFAQNKKHGSKDRRAIRHLCYAFFRLGRMAPGLSVEDRILAGLFLSSETPDELWSLLPGDLQGSHALTVGEKLGLLTITLGANFKLDELFPVLDLSEGVDAEAFSTSMFRQPRVFLRLRPGKENMVIARLKEASISYREITDTAIAMPAATKINELVPLDEEAVVQDLSSQRIKEFFPPIRAPRTWDCCAASGGKSLLAWDHYGPLDLTVTDIRSSILSNLRERFMRAGIARYKWSRADLLQPGAMPRGPFDFIIADLPCTGSGTWSRTPEEMATFDPASVQRFSSLQRAISTNVIHALEEGGYFLYITCSALAEENERNARALANVLPIQLLEMRVLPGYEEMADTMFAALFRKIKGE